MIGAAAGTRTAGGWFARLALAFAAALWLGAPAAAASDKTDVVELVNGDRITGEIKGLSRGKLDYKTDDAGRLSIEWVKVVEVTSVHRFEIELSDGARHYGALQPLREGERRLVRLAGGDTFPVEAVVSLVPLEKTLVSRLQAYLDIGFTLAKSNSARTLTSDGFVQYRGELLGSSLAFDAYGQDAADSTAVNRDSLKLTGDMYLGRWKPQVWAQAERNDELALQLRLTLGAGVSYAAIQGNTMELSAQAGLSGLQEDYAGSDPAYSLTASLSVAWDVFHYDSPNLDAGLSLAVYPYLTDVGRVRLEGALRVKYELFSDFHVGLNVSDTYDTRPPDRATASNDYLLSFTIGWSYRR